MAKKKKDNKDNISIKIEGSPLQAGRNLEIKGKENINTTIGGLGEGTTVVLGDDVVVDTSTADFEAMLAAWKAELDTKIETQPDLANEDKEDLKETVAKIEAEALKGSEANPGRIEKLLNTLAIMGPDIFEVAVTTLANPLLGINLVLKKVGDKAKLESVGQAK